MSPDLKLRIPSAILYVIIIASAFLYGPWTAAILLWIFFALCLYEFVLVSSPKQLYGYMAVGHLLVALAALGGISDTLHWIIVGVSSVAMTIFGLHLVTLKRASITKYSLSVGTLGYAILPFVVAISTCLRYDRFSIVLLGSFIIIWLNDAGAYFVGRAIGKRKIFPSVSPGKSWEGWIGGAVVGVISTFIISRYFLVLNLSEWINLSIILSITGLLGDLTESSWKRSHGLKDSSHLFPGHGGFLDRLDSFIYSVPFIALGYLLLLQLR